MRHAVRWVVRLGWFFAVACSAGREGVDGGEPCVDDCVAEGAAVCSGAATFRLCGHLDLDRCLDLSTTVFDCPAGATCQSGQCSAPDSGSCTNECAVNGGTTCDGTSGTRTCGQFDADSCLELSAPQQCPSGQQCDAGVCAEVNGCSDDCPMSGAVSCDGTTGTRVCGNYDSDPCLELSTVTPCGRTEACSSGSCMSVCTDECPTVGSPVCASDSAIRTCGNFDPDPCYEYSPESPCTSAQNCVGGACVSCADECTTFDAGQCETTGDAGFRLCGNFDSDTCFELASTVTYCAAGDVCSSGTCAPPNAPPVATFTATVSSVTAVQVDANAVSDAETPAGALEVCWDWDNSGGCDTAYSTTKLQAHDYGVSGVFTIGMQVRDAAGQISRATRTTSTQNIQYVGGVTLMSTVWSGTVVVTGDVTVAAGQTLTVAAGTHVLFAFADVAAPTGVGDYGLLVLGDLVVNGTAASPVLFSGFQAGGKTAGSWDRVVLMGSNTSISHAIVEYADVGLEIRGDAVIDQVVVRSTRGDGVVLSSAPGASLGHLTVTGAGGYGLRAGSAAAFTLSHARLSDNVSGGILASGGSTPTIMDSVIERNGGAGIRITDSTATISHNRLADNRGVGLYVEGNSGGTSAQYNVITRNDDSGVAVWNGVNGTPTPDVGYSNIHANAVAGSTVPVLVNPSATLTASHTCCTSSTSSSYTAPAGTRIVRALVTFNEGTSASGDQGALLDGFSNPLRTWTTNAMEWVYIPAGVTALRVRVSDSFSSDTESISVSQLELAEWNTSPSSRYELVASTASGTTLARFNFWTPNVTDVPNKLMQLRAGSVDFQGATGIEYSSTQVGPRP